MSKAISLLAILLMTAVAATAQSPGWIGVSIEDGRDSGATVQKIERNSPAETAGMKEGDLIVEFNREPVIGVQQFTRLVRETPAGRTVDVKVRRGNQEQTLKLTVERSPQFQKGGLFEFDAPGFQFLTDRIGRDLQKVEVNTVFAEAGIHVQQLTDQLRDFFGVYNSGGVLVTAVDRGSDGEKSGLKAGDVVTSINGRMVRTPGEFSREMRNAGAKSMLRIIRNKAETDIAMP